MMRSYARRPNFHHHPQTYKTCKTHFCKFCRWLRHVLVVRRRADVKLYALRKVFRAIRQRTPQGDEAARIFSRILAPRIFTRRKRGNGA
jgi:hypothetical protein